MVKKLQENHNIAGSTNHQGTGGGTALARQAVELGGVEDAVEVVVLAAGDAEGDEGAVLPGIERRLAHRLEAVVAVEFRGPAVVYELEADGYEVSRGATSEVWLASSVARAIATRTYWLFSGHPFTEIERIVFPGCGFALGHM